MENPNKVEQFFNRAEFVVVRVFLLVLLVYHLYKVLSHVLQ